MSFLGVLGNIGKGLLGNLPGVGAVVNGIAGGRAQGGQADFTNQLSAQRQNNQALLDAFKARMDAAKFGEDMQGQRANDALRGSLMQNMRDVSATHPRANVVHFAGGLRPSAALNPTARGIGSQLSQIAGSQFGHDQVMPPQLQTGVQAPQGGFLDSLLGVAGPALSLGSLLQKKPSLPSFGGQGQQGISGPLAGYPLIPPQPPRG